MTQPCFVYTAGVCLYVILAGCLPFESASMPELLRRIQRGQYETPPWMSPAAARVIASLLQPDPRQRCVHLARDPWQGQLVPSNLNRFRAYRSSIALCTA